MAAVNTESPAVSQVTLVGANLADSIARLLSQEGKAIVAEPYVESAGTDAAYTITAANIVGGFLVAPTLTAGRTYTLPTAALLVAGVPNAKLNQIVGPFTVIQNGGAFALTIAAGAGGTLKGTAASAATAGHGITVYIALTNVTAGTEAYIAYSTGA
jgi:hypothetical protein